MEAKRRSFKCVVCGYIHVGEAPPKECPICASSASEFEPYEEKISANAAAPQAWRCLNCEHVHTGPNPPDKCPVCGVSREKFEGFTPKERSGKAADVKKTYVIIGGGVAALSSAEEIRKNSANAEILMLSSEKSLPYYRLNLTRYLAGEVAARDLPIHDKTWYDANGIRIHLDTPVHSFDREKKEVKLENGSVIHYDTLILSMGAHPFIPPLEGSTLRNVISVRTLDDANYVLERIRGVKTCVCIGGGILGLEAAGALSRRGVKIILLEGAPWLMPRQLNQQGSQILKEYLSKLGIEVMENVKIKKIAGTVACEKILLESGEEIPAQLVLITAGVRPNTSLARKAGLEVNQGVVVDNHLRTSDHEIFAAGDITEHYGTVYGLWHISQFQGRIAGLNAVGITTEFGGIPRSNVLKVLDIDLFSIGDFTSRDGSYTEFSREENGKYYHFVLRDGKISGCIIIGNMKLSTAVKKSMDQGTEFPGTIYDSLEKIIEKLG